MHWRISGTRNVFHKPWRYPRIAAQTDYWESIMIPSKIDQLIQTSAKAPPPEARQLPIQV